MSLKATAGGQLRLPHQQNKQESRAIAERTGRCPCKFRNIEVYGGIAQFPPRWHGFRIK